MRGPPARPAAKIRRLEILELSDVAMGQDGQQRNDREALMSRFTRPEQTFPALTSAEIERIRHFGELRTYSDRELLFETGSRDPACSSS